MRRITASTPAAALVWLLVQPCLAWEPSLPPPAPAGELRERRARLLESMAASGDERAALMLRAPAPDHFAGDVDYTYRPDNDLYYLSGIAAPGCELLLTRRPVGALGHVLLFISRESPADRIWTGAGLSRDEAAETAGVEPQAVLWNDESRVYLAGALDVGAGIHRAGVVAPRQLYFETGAGFVPGRMLPEPYAYLVEVLGSTAFRLDLRPPRTLIHPLRQIKSAAELALLRKAIDATCHAQIGAMRRARPGIHEFELRAEVEATFVREGCDGWGFPSIVGSGPNTCTLHYERYDRRSRDGDLVLIDIGAQYGYYSGDVTRTFPVDGRFTPRQRQIYSIVLAAQKAGIEAVRPGAGFADVDRTAREHVRAGLADLGLLNVESDISRFFPHGTSHGLGLAVHDPMPKATLAAGMVITVEPGIYLTDEGIGVRIEDDVLVTIDGREVLSIRAPKEIDEIEALMAARRL